MSEQHVRDLHTKTSEEMYAPDCANGECSHDGECPLEATDVCQHCFDTALASEYSQAEETTPIYTWPCPTIKALDKPAEDEIGGQQP